MQEKVSIGGVDIYMAKSPIGIGLTFDVPKDKVRKLVQEASAFRKKMQLVPGTFELVSAMQKLETAVLKVLSS